MLTATPPRKRSAPRRLNDGATRPFVVRRHGEGRRAPYSCDSNFHSHG
jgi:hypothetical protein